ncbi:UNVERIFIED_CONTAM: hypothetical protein NCL1_22641 [Trichonephila clavipes]
MSVDCSVCLKIKLENTNQVSSLLCLGHMQTFSNCINENKMDFCKKIFLSVHEGRNPVVVVFFHATDPRVLFPGFPSMGR